MPVGPKAVLIDGDLKHAQGPLTMGAARANLANQVLRAILKEALMRLSTLQINASAEPLQRLKLGHGHAHVHSETELKLGTPTLFLTGFFYFSFACFFWRPLD